MGRKLVIDQFKLIDAADATGAITSAATNVTSVDEMTIHCLFSTNNTGSFSVEARNFVPDNPVNDVNAYWYELDFGSVLSITADNEVQIVFNSLSFKQIRLKWAPSAGAGTLTAYVVAKVVGA